MLVNKSQAKKIIIIALSCAAVVYLTNYTFLYLFFKRNYTYSNFDGTYKFQEFGMKGVTYSTAKMKYDLFLEDNPSVKDRQLYRTFWITPWRFWEWRQYIEGDERFKLPYISESEIAKNRDIQDLNK